MFLVFKTTVDSLGKAQKLTPYLERLPLPGRWNFDLADCDHILRVEGPCTLSDTIIHTLKEQGFECIELE